MQQKLNWYDDLFTNGENLHGKNLHRVILRSLLLKIPYYQNKWLPVKESQYFIPTCSWTHNQLDLFCSDNLSFQCMAPSTWLTNCADPSTWLQSPTREGCWLQSSSVHHTIKIEKILGHKILWCTNTATSSQERWTRANSVFGHNLHEKTLLNTCATCVTFDGP